MGHHHHLSCHHHRHGCPETTNGPAASSPRDRAIPPSRTEGWDTEKSYTARMSPGLPHSRESPGYPCLFLHNFGNPTVTPISAPG